MTDKVKIQLETLRKKAYRALRSDIELDITEKLAGKSGSERSVSVLTELLYAERPRTFEGDRIGFHRYIRSGPHYIDENGKKVTLWDYGNITVNYAGAIGKGMDAVLEEIRASRDTLPSEHRTFLNAAEEAVLAALSYADRAALNALDSGNAALAATLSQIPRKSARNLEEALSFMKFILFTLRCNTNTHLTIGRFDQYMFPYYQADRRNGMTVDEALELLEEFFISLNFDTDLYFGVQQGDNGQSMVLGGCLDDGADAWNELSELCLKASLELNLIDPKINMRVSKDTPFERYLLGTRLTKQGMGFPQYCNDDIVIPGLLKLGYDLKDARNYTVAACWEYIIPNCGMDIPNIVTMNFPLVVERATEKALDASMDFDTFLGAVDNAIRDECDKLIDEGNRYVLPPSPYLSVFVDDCISKGLDLGDCGAKYNNYGCHGAGIATAADALTAIKTAVFDDKTVEKKDLLAAVKADFEGYGELRSYLLSQPKMGSNEELPDSIACHIMKTFAENMNLRPNSRGGIYRAGTGSAMEYLWSAAKVGATADGRKAGEPYGSSFSPSLTSHPSGILSVLQSFTKFDMTRIINGGPLTVEIHDTAFRNEDGVEKVAKLVELFILLGGHQLQLNAVNHDRLIDAQRHPENYPHLIVRVWGWSGYFNELDLCYQNHIIARTEFAI